MSVLETKREKVGSVLYSRIPSLKRRDEQWEEWKHKQMERQQIKKKGGDKRKRLPSPDERGVLGSER